MKESFEATVKAAAEKYSHSTPNSVGQTVNTSNNRTPNINENQRNGRKNFQTINSPNNIRQIQSIVVHDREKQAKQQIYKLTSDENDTKFRSPNTAKRILKARKAGSFGHVLDQPESLPKKHAAETIIDSLEASLRHHNIIQRRGGNIIINNTDSAQKSFDISVQPKELYMKAQSTPKSRYVEHEEKMSMFSKQL